MTEGAEPLVKVVRQHGRGEEDHAIGMNNYFELSLDNNLTWAIRNIHFS